MKKFRNIVISSLILLLSLVLIACSQTFTVNFVDYDGTILKTEKVAEGAGATAPEAPIHSGLEFVKWDADYSVVTQDMDVKAIYFGLNETKK